MNQDILKQNWVFLNSQLHSSCGVVGFFWQLISISALLPKLKLVYNKLDSFSLYLQY